MIETNKLSNISASLGNNKVQVVTNGQVPLDDVQLLNPAGFMSNPSGGGGFLLFIYHGSSNFVAIPYQFNEKLPDNFNENESGLYDLETAENFIKLNKDSIEIEAKEITLNSDGNIEIEASEIILKTSSIKVNKNDGKGPREIALVGDQTSDGAIIVGSI